MKLRYCNEDLYIFIFTVFNIIIILVEVQSINQSKSQLWQGRYQSFRREGAEKQLSIIYVVVDGGGVGWVGEMII